MGWKTAETISNLGIVTEVKFSYTLLGDHHKTPETLPVCFTCPFISDITNLLEARLLRYFFWRRDPSTEMFGILGEFAFGFVLGFFFPTLSNLMPPPSSVCSFLFLAGVCCFKRGYFGFPLLTCARVAVAPCPCPFQEC